jgi:hypothetical protein
VEVYLHPPIRLHGMVLSCGEHRDNLLYFTLLYLVNSLEIIAKCGVHITAMLFNFLQKSKIAYFLAIFYHSKCQCHHC